MDLDGRSFLKKGQSLLPADEAAGEFLSGLPEGKEILVSVRRARSPQHHRWFFKLLTLACAHLREHHEKGMPKLHDAEELLDALKIAVGHVRPLMRLDGSVVFVPKSIDFASLPEDAFIRFKDRALYVLGRILGFDPVILMEGEQSPQGGQRRAA